MNVKARLIQFLESVPISQGEFEKKVGLSNGFVNNIGDGIRTRSLNKIIAKYPELNTTWLLTGEGDMIINKAPSSFKMTEETAYIKVLINAIVELQVRDNPKKTEAEFRADLAKQAKVILGRIPSF